MMISAHQWFSSPMPVYSCTQAMILNSGMNSSESGIRYVRNTPVASEVDPQNRMRPSENAAGTAISIVMTTTATEITAELRKNVRYCSEVSSALKFSSVG